MTQEENLIQRNFEHTINAIDNMEKVTIDAAKANDN